MYSRGALKLNNGLIFHVGDVPEQWRKRMVDNSHAVSYTHLRAHETRSNLVCRLLLEKKKF